MHNVFRFRRLRWRAPPRLRGAPRSRSRRRHLDLVWVSVLLVTFALSAAVLSPGFRGEVVATIRSAAASVPVATPPLTQAASHFPLCSRAREPTCVIDGDTFRHEGTTIRIADIDAPEVRGSQCAAEKALGDRATSRMQALLNAGSFTLEPADRDKDRYGRKLRVVTRNGQSLGMILVAEGLARPWDGARRPWC